MIGRLFNEAVLKFKRLTFITLLNVLSILLNVNIFRQLYENKAKVVINFAIINVKVIYDKEYILLLFIINNEVYFKLYKEYNLLKKPFCKWL